MGNDMKDKKKKKKELQAMDEQSSSSSSSSSENMEEISCTPKKEEPIHDISQQEVDPQTSREQLATPLSPQQERVTPLTPQQQGAIPRRHQEQESVPEAVLQEGVTPPSQHEDIRCRRRRELDVIVETLAKQKKGKKQQEKQEQQEQQEQQKQQNQQEHQAIPPTFQQVGVNPVAPQQQGSVPGRHEEQQAIPPTLQQERALLGSPQQQGASRGRRQGEREVLLEPPPYELHAPSPAAHDREPEEEIQHMEEGRIYNISIPEDTHQPVPVFDPEPWRNRACEIDFLGKKLNIFFIVIGLVGLVFVINELPAFSAVEKQRSKLPKPIYRLDTESEYKLPEASKLLVRLHGKDNLNSCNSLYTVACDAYDKRHKWHVKSTKNVRSQMEERIHNWITDQEDRWIKFTHNFDIVRKFYRLCTADPDIKTGRYFDELLSRTGNAAKLNYAASFELTGAALKNGLFAYVFAEPSIVETDEGLAEFELNLPSVIVNDMYERMWQPHRLYKIKSLIHSWMSPKGLFKNGKLEKFAIDILNLIKNVNSSKFNPEHAWLEKHFIERSTGVSKPRYKINPKMEHYLHDLNELLGKTDLNIVVNYFKIMVIIHDCIYLPGREVNGCADFHGMKPFNETCYSIARNSTWFQGLHVFEYTQNYISEINTVTINRITHSVIKTLENRLKGDMWLNSIAVNGAIQHLNNLTAVLGWKPYIGSIEYEQKSYPHLYRSQYGSHLIHFVTGMRQNYTHAQWLKTQLSARDLDIVNRLHHPMAISEWANYHPLTHELVVNPVAFRMLPLNPKEDVPMYYQMATIGVWIATAVLKSFNFPNISKDSCIIPSEFWKYNVKLYSDNVAKCTEFQFNEYISIFDIKDAKTQSAFGYENMFDIIGPRLAFNAYQLYFTPEPVDNLDLTAEQAFWLIMTSHRCDSNRNLNTDYLSTNFSVVGPAFTSKEFDLVFQCNKYSNMFSGAICLMFRI
uniref:Peptidase M13 N-terminal domain-containing protein n=1 Tax=Dendroctonus ponderosae TaxID=77166 RepID=A0AAR5PTD1_DENPD